MTSKKPEPLYLFLGFAVLFLIMRLWFLYASGEILFQAEELVRGAIAYELMQGLNFPFNDYRPDAYGGGTLIIALLAAPFFYLFGPTVFAYKLAPLCMAFFSFVMALIFLKRFFGDRAFRLGALLLIFCPSVLVGLSLTGNGDHCESIFFNLVLLLCFYELVFSEKRQVLMGGLIGISAGLGIWFMPTTLSAVAAVALAWIVIRPKTLFGRPGFTALLGFFLGMLPWLFHNLSHDFKSLWLYSELVNQDSMKPDFSLLWILPFTFFGGLQPRLNSLVLSLLYSLTCCLTLLFVLKKSFRDDRVLCKKFYFFGIYFFLHLTISMMTHVDFRNFSDHYSLRYLAPLYFLFFLFVAAFISRLPRGIFIILPLLFLGLLGQAHYLFAGIAGSSLQLKGYSYYDLGELFTHNQTLPEDQFNEYEDYTKRWKASDARFMFWGVGTSREMSDEYEHKISLSQVPMKDRGLLLEARGYRIAEEGGLNFQELYERWKASLVPDQQHLLRGYVMAWASLGYEPAEIPNFSDYGDDADVFFHFEQGSWDYKPFRKFEFKSFDGFKKNELAKKWYWRGVGRAIAHRCLVDPKPRIAECFAPFSLLDPSIFTEIYWGIGWGFSEAWLEDQPRARLRLERLYPKMKPAAEEGYQACVKWYSLR